MICGASLLLALAQSLETGPSASDGPLPPFVVERGEGRVPVHVPRGEELVFDVILDLGVFGEIDVGDVTLTSGVERIARDGLPSARAVYRSVTLVDRAWIHGVAEGGYAGYSVREDIETSHVPQAWPSILYTMRVSGSENRRRELKLGTLEGAFQAWYRSDGHCRGCTEREHFVKSVWSWGDPYHCEKCKRAEHRVWREPQIRAVPDDGVDMLSAVYVGRAMIPLAVRETKFALIDRQHLWSVQVEQGGRRVIDVPAGRFDCTEMKLTSAPHPSVAHQVADEKFQGLFGIQGAIRIWFEAASGVPVLIEGQLPIPVPLVGDLDLRILLRSAKGTPPGFVSRR
jgi:hypothetical protein